MDQTEKFWGSLLGAEKNTNQFNISCQLDKLLKGNTQILVCDFFEISLVNKGPIYYSVFCVCFQHLKWHQITWAFFSSVANFSLKPTYIGHYKLGWENAMAVVHNVSKKLRQGERPTAWQVQEFRSVSLGLPRTARLQKAVSEVNPQSAGSQNFSARHQKPGLQQGLTPYVSNGMIPYGLHPHN